LDGFWEKPYSQKPHDLLSFDHPPLMISVDEDEKVLIYKGGLVKSKVEAFKLSNSIG
jgi:hypothetical protein